MFSIISFNNPHTVCARMNFLLDSNCLYVACSSMMFWCSFKNKLVLQYKWPIVIHCIKMKTKSFGNFVMWAIYVLLSLISLLDRIWQWLLYLMAVAIWASLVNQNCGTLHYRLDQYNLSYQSFLVQFILLFQTDWLHGIFLEDNAMKILTWHFN